MEPIIQHILDKKDQYDIFDSPYMPDVRVVDFKADILSRRLAGIKKQLHSFSDFEGYGTLDEMKNVYSKLLTKCQKLEEIHKPELERQCKWFVEGMFAVPYQTTDITCKIVSVVKPEKMAPVNKSVEAFGDYDDMNQANSITNAISKRVIANALIEGGAIELSGIMDGIVAELYKINPELPLLYKKLMAVHDFIEFCDLADQDEKNVRLDGYVTVKMKSDMRTEIIAEGTAFPFVMREAIKGVLQLVCSASLPEQVKEAAFVAGQADYINAEPYYARFGVILWKALFGGITVDTEVLPYYLNNLFDNDVRTDEDLKDTLQNIFMRTRKGLELRNQLYKEAEKHVSYLKFLDEIHEKNAKATSIVVEPEDIANIEF